MGREPVALEDVEALSALAERVRPVTLARDRQLPVLPELEPLLPGGALQRGTTVAVDAGRGVTGATTLALAVAAGASQAGSWVAMVGMGAVGLVAADRLGVSFERLALVTPPSSSRGGWASTMAALVDGFDVVLVGAGPGARLRSGDARRLASRVRERGAVLVAVGGELPGQRSNVHLTVTSATWLGLEDGAGHLSRRRVTVAASGRGGAARPRRATLWLPARDGRIAAVEPEATPIPLHDPSVLAPVAGVGGPEPGAGTGQAPGSAAPLPGSPVAGSGSPVAPLGAVLQGRESVAWPGSPAPGSSVALPGSSVAPLEAVPQEREAEERAAASARHPSAGAHRGGAPVVHREARPRRRRVGHPTSPRQARPDRSGQPGQVAEGAAS